MKGLILDENERVIAIGLEYFEGKRLNKINQQIIEQIEDAIRYLHANNYFHGDLKPSNISINNKDKIKMLDFGAFTTKYNPDWIVDKEADWICLKLIKNILANAK
ncbi:uncharacterized protein ASCRUDRAFT_8150 [Ascoidea rubescens DSM 1968]|uniref:Protein kinase domain-containing protein n=1 Tax=Ascoidea rubescens DSM 1968 TaxID=1344418 RepID=A0A1D2VIB8_9ASCO|nr:hypothetical protein ASCRUDRAFT_8150 [Ascoidea rubescens DSM 1968]ODV61217.1 hypothetical protein ASCRUDRAFT_8150 [Ascoidea rubescens DSM 1968]